MAMVAVKLPVVMAAGVEEILSLLVLVVVVVGFLSELEEGVVDCRATVLEYHQVVEAVDFDQGVVAVVGFHFARVDQFLLWADFAEY